MTIEQIQAAIDSKADARQIINMIADYIQDNPGGGGLTLYSGDGALAGDREVDLNGKVLQFEQGGIYLLTLDTTANNENSILQAYNITGGGNNAVLYATTTDTFSNFNFVALFNGVVKQAHIIGEANATTATIAYTADTHTFNGVINLPVQANASPQDGDVWRVDNTNTGLKIRINGVTKTITVS